MEELLLFLHCVYPLTEGLRAHLGQIIKWKEVPAGEYILKLGHYCDHVYFVGNGLLRSFYYDKRGKEVNFWFMKGGDVVYSVESFLDRIPSPEYIQALEDTFIFYISYRELQHTYEEHITFNINGRKLTEEYYKRSVEREKIMRMPEAIDRYNYLVEHFPDLMNAVPDKHLATFLRMTPVTISRLRNKRMKRPA